MPRTSFTSYAQNLEDILLWRALGHVKSGCYIDIGAYDPIQDSVSRGFYEQGWRGVHFEPDAAQASRLRENRPDETVHAVALSDVEGTLPFFVVPATGLSTGSVDYATAYSRDGRTVEERLVKTTTLASACGELAGRDVHWMKIDVEGMEDRVLRGWDAASLRPWVVVVEATRPNSAKPSHQPWDGLLVAAGYEFVFFDGLNRFYVAREHPELRAAFAAPANIHDLIAGCELAASNAFAAAPVRSREATIAAMQSSRSWRWTRPLRRLLALLGRPPVVP